MEENKETSNDFTNYNGSVGGGMNQLQLAVECLIREIEISEQYKNFLDTKRAIEKFPEKLRMANEFREKNFELQMRGDQIDLFDEMDLLAKEYEPYIKDKIIGDYLQAEMEFCNLMQEINYAIFEPLEIDVEFVK